MIAEIDKKVANLALEFREPYIEGDYQLIIRKLEEFAEELGEESEYSYYFQEAADILNMMLNINKNEIRNYINNLPWDNFYDDTDQPYSLGSMFYNKMEWAREGLKEENEEISEAAHMLSEKIPAIFDELEQYVTK